MKIITVTGYKGGVGKSTTAFHLASFFSEKGKVVLVDGDQNRTVKNWSLRNKDSLPFIVADQRQAMKLVSTADYIVIDTPARPESDDLKELSEGCELLVLPTVPDILSIEPMLHTIRDVRNTTYRTLLTVVPPKPSLEGHKVKNDLRESGINVFESMIRRTAGFPKAAFEGVPIKNISNPKSLE